MGNAAYRLIRRYWRQVSSSTCAVTIVTTLLTNATLQFYNLHRVKGVLAAQNYLSHILSRVASFLLVDFYA
jgi:hypothetical protein